jgi:hypothetical protein
MMQSQEVRGFGDVQPGAPVTAERGFLTQHVGIPAEPLFGVLPVRRVIPQNVHSLLDYSNGAMVAWAGLSSRKREAKLAGAILGAAVIGVSLLTDYRMSVAKVIPIEVHEALDHLWGIATIAAPFVLGYERRAPITTLVHVLTGAGAIVGSLFTDYRADKGVGRQVARSLRGQRGEGALTGADLRAAGAYEE